MDINDPWAQTPEPCSADFYPDPGNGTGILVVAHADVLAYGAQEALVLAFIRSHIAKRPSICGLKFIDRRTWVPIPARIVGEHLGISTAAAATLLKRLVDRGVILKGKFQISRFLDPTAWYTFDREVDNFPTEEARQ